jgi:pimeloyl-ACP methyl ester carboxylesterase
LWAPPAAGKGVVVFFHGNATDLAGMTWFAAALMNQGYGVMLVEYPGYGVAPGSPSESAIYASAALALDELAQLGVAQSRVVLAGQSLGSGVAAEMAQRGYGARLLLISPFTSIPDLVDGIVPFGLGGLFATDRFDTLSKATSLKLPTVIAQGDEDWLVPLEMAQEVADKLPNARMVVFEGGGHNDLFEREDGALMQLIYRLADSVAVPPQ